MAGIAEAYKDFVDNSYTFTDEELAEFPAQFEEFVEGRVRQLLSRWRLMNTYVRNGLDRQATAKLARQVARSSCAWLMAVHEIPAYDWTYSGPLMPEAGSEEQRELNHLAASLDISDWLMRWREDTVTRMQWFCSMAACAMERTSIPMRKSLRKRINRTANAVQKEIDGVLHAIQVDRAKPKKAKKDTSDSEV